MAPNLYILCHKNQLYSVKVHKKFLSVGRLVQQDGKFKILKFLFLKKLCKTNYYMSEIAPILYILWYKNQTYSVKFTKQTLSSSRKREKIQDIEAIIYLKIATKQIITSQKWLEICNLYAVTTSYISQRSKRQTLSGGRLVHRRIFLSFLINTIKNISQLKIYSKSIIMAPNQYTLCHQKQSFSVKVLKPILLAKRQRNKLHLLLIIRV